MTPTSADDRYEVGLQLFRAGTYALAERTLRDALAIDAGHHASLALLGLTLYNLTRYRDALAAANASLALYPSVDALRVRAMASAELGDLPGAVVAARDVVRLAPSDALAADTLGTILEQSGQLGEAGAQYRRATKLEPDNLGLRADYGRFLVRSRRLADGEEVAAGIAVDADARTVLLLRGEIALLRGRLNEARDFALWMLSRNARDLAAIQLLTLTIANRNPLLKLWWKHTQAMAFWPRWQRVLWMILLIAAGILVAGLPVLFFFYLRLARRHVNRKAQAELEVVELRPDF